MKQKYSLLLIVIIFITMLLSGCSGNAATAASSWPGIAVDEETAYIAYNQHIYAVNLENGLEKWRFPAEAERNVSFFAAPVLTSDGQLIAGGYNNVLYSIDPNTGTENWSYTSGTDRYIGSPLALGERIYAVDGGDQILALDLKGNLIWSYTTLGAQWAQPTSALGCDCIYVSSMDHHLYAISGDNGELTWKTEDLGGSIVGKPALSSDGILYIGTFGREVYAIDTQDGSIIWQNQVDGWVWGGPILNGDQLYFGDLKGNFYALDAKDGSILQRIQPDGPIIESPLIDEDTIYFSTEAGTLYAVDPQMTTRWSRPIGGKLYTSPILSGDLILAAPMSADNMLYALDKNGTQQWVFTPEKK